MQTEITNQAPASLTPEIRPSNPASFESAAEAELHTLWEAKHQTAIDDWQAAEPQRLAAAAAAACGVQQLESAAEAPAVSMRSFYLHEVRNRLLARSPEEIAADETRLAEELAAERRLQLTSYWTKFIKARGDRYAGCRLANFDVSDDAEVAPKQRKVLAALTAYCRTIDDRIVAGDGLVLFGPKGTGKDHLLVAVARVAIQRGYRVLWRNGMTLFAEQRDSMHEGDNEALIRRLVSADVLYLSDPLRPLGPLTDYQMECLQAILDGRYNAGRPTWCSVNVKDGDELDQRMGPQNGDRLRDHAIGLYCDWTTHRRPLRVDDLLAEAAGRCEV